MNETDKRERLQQRIAKDINTLKSMVGEDDTLLRGYVQLIATGKMKEAREMLSLLNRITDNITRLENLEPGSANTAFRYDTLAYQSLGAAAVLFIAALKGREAQR